MTIRISLVLNGQPRQCEVQPTELASGCLRERFQLSGLHVACGEGVCGACSVLLDGQPVRSCLLLAPQLDGRTVVTIEGLQDAPLGRQIQDALVRHNAFQCGYCASGVVFALYEVLQAPLPSEDAERILRTALSCVICRCTGYVNMLKAGLELSGARAEAASNRDG